MEKRAFPRFPYKMKAFALDTGREVLFQSEDISAGGVYLTGSLDVAVGETLWLRFEVSTTRDGREWVYPVDAEIEVVRVTKGAGGVVQGFAGRWRSIVSHADIEPLLEFLRRVLSLTAGFIQAFEPRNDLDKPSFVFAFPGPEARVQETGKAGAESGAQKGPEARRTGIYVILPITYRVGDEEYEGRAIKMREHGVRIATNGPLPEAYRKVLIRIPVRQKDRVAYVELWSTVTSVRRAMGEGEGQFEVEFALTNEPESLAAYRRIVDQLTRALSDSQGL